MSSSIHQILNLPPKGSALSLGPVKVTSAYPVSTSSNGKKYVNINVEDSSGKCKMTLWESAANCRLAKGDVVTFIGAIKRNDYNGVTSITTSDAKISDGGEGNGQEPQASTNNTSNFKGASAEKLSIYEMALQIAQFTSELQEQLANAEINKEIITEIVKSAPQIAALWWFGEKRLKANPDPLESNEEAQ
jgi:DNA polymerase III alpha subunit